MHERQKPILEVSGLSTRFKTRSGAVYAVNGVSFDLHAGEILAVVGESGSGKSVTMMSIVDLLPKDSAVIEADALRFDGRDLRPEDQIALRGKRIGFVFQDPMTSLNPVFTIGDQIAEPLRLHLGLNKRAALARAAELLDLVGISDAQRRLSDYPHQLSGGMRQRVMIALALACEPDVLIADEPTTALDVTIQAQIIDMVHDLRKKMGMAIVWITHDLGVVAEIADRVLVMYGGQIVEHAPADRLFAAPAHPYTQALLATIPSLHGPRPARLQAIEGQPPLLGARPTACPFQKRCHVSIALCQNANPPRRAVDGAGEHDAACHLIAEVAHA